MASAASRHGPTYGLFLHPPSPLEAGIEGNQQENQQDHEDGDQSFLPLEDTLQVRATENCHLP
jgi:hypothetical protein